MINEIAINLISSIIEKVVEIGYDQTSKKYQVAKLLKSKGVLKLKESFDSIYLHSILAYGEKKKELGWVKLFGLTEVITSFHQLLVEKKMDKNIFIEKIQEELKFNAHKYSALTKLYYENPVKDQFISEVNEFSERFEEMTQYAQTPAGLKLFNKLQEIQDATLKKSFPYQSQKYMEKVWGKFQEEYLNKNKYVELNGEERKVKSEIQINSYKDLDVMNIENFEKGGSPNKGSKNLLKKKNQKVENNTSYGSITHKPLDSFINQWLASNEQNLLIILGEYGTGKTTYMEYLTHQLAIGKLDESIQLKITDEKKRIPFLFHLRDFEMKMESYITYQFHKNGIQEITFPQFLERIDKEEVLLILDGFDEMTNQIDSDEKRRNFDKISKIVSSSKNSKVILTCREEYFRSEEDIEKVFKHKDKNNYTFVHLLPFDDFQIQDYLNKHTTNSDFYWNEIQNIFDLHDLAKRPVLLELIVLYLPSLIKEKSTDNNTSIKATDLYQKCIEEELNRKSNELKFLIPGKGRLDILQDLSVWMLHKDVLNFDIRYVEEELNLKQYFQTTSNWEFEKHLNEFLSFTFLILEADNQFRISHKSFRDYLVARSYTQEINNNNIYNDFPRTKTSEEINKFIIELEPKKEVLLEWVLKSKDLKEETQWLGTNAASILLKIDKTALKAINLSDCHLKDVDFTDADLIETIFYNCNLIGTKFNKTLLQKAIIQKCDFNNGVLDLEGYEEDISLDFLNRLKNLNQIKLGNTSFSDFNQLSKCTKLTELYLGKTKILDLRILKELKELTKLSIWETKISDISHLKNLSKLEQLAIDYTLVKNINVVKHLRHLIYLSLTNTPVEDFSPIQECTKLTELHLGDTKISDLGILKELKELTKLNIWETKISDISHLINFPKLEELGFGFTQVKDINVVKHLKKLIDLNLTNTPVEDFSPIRECTKLTELHLGKTKISDLGILKELKELTKLNIWETKITGLSDLQNLSKLELLGLSDTQIKDINVVKHLKQLNYLSLRRTPIEDFSPIQECTKLTELHLGKTKISDLGILKELKELTKLNIWETKITDISHLKNLSKLELLSLSDTQVKDINIIKHFKKLIDLNLAGTPVEDFSPIRECTKLTELHLGKTKISDLGILKELKELTKLSIWETKITDISHLKNLSKLELLGLSDTQIKDINVVKHLKQLIDLNLAGTPVEDFSPIRECTKLTELHLGKTKILDLGILKELKELTKLYIWETKITDISHLKNLSKLKELDLNNTRISNFEIIGELENIEKINVNETSFNNLTILKDLKALKKLDISKTPIETLPNLQLFSQLDEIGISDSQVNDLKFFESMKELKSLFWWSPPIHIIENIEKLIQLTELSFREAIINDFSHLLKLENIIELSFRDMKLDGISKLASLQNLERINLREIKTVPTKELENFQSLKVLEIRNSNINPNHIEELKKKLPLCQVIIIKIK